MEGRHAVKIAGGKLLQVKVDVADGKLNEIKITGDFFAHPEDSIEQLEDALRGSARSQINTKTEGFFRQNAAKLYGVDAKSIAKAILEAWDGMQTA